MKDIMISINVEGAETPIVTPVDKAGAIAKELDKAGKKWTLGSTY
jgi:hypothetical protein